MVSLNFSSILGTVEVVSKAAPEALFPPTQSGDLLSGSTRVTFPGSALPVVVAAAALLAVVVGGSDEMVGSMVGMGVVSSSLSSGCTVDVVDVVGTIVVVSSDWSSHAA